MEIDLEREMKTGFSGDTEHNLGWSWIVQIIRWWIQQLILGCPDHWPQDLDVKVSTTVFQHRLSFWCSGSQIDYSTKLYMRHPNHTKHLCNHFLALKLEGVRRLDLQCHLKPAIVFEVIWGADKGDSGVVVSFHSGSESSFIGAAKCNHPHIVEGHSLLQQSIKLSTQSLPLKVVKHNCDFCIVGCWGQIHELIQCLTPPCPLLKLHHLSTPIVVSFPYCSLITLRLWHSKVLRSW